MGENKFNQVAKCSLPGFQMEVFYGTQYHSVIVWWYYQVFSFFAMGKMVIFSMYIIEKKSPPSIHLVSRILPIPFCISDNTRILPIPPMNTTHTTKNRWYTINLNRRPYI
jgi:hypothetical protein